MSSKRFPGCISKRSVAFLFTIALFVWALPLAIAQTNEIMVQVDKPGTRIPATLFGVFFEDINFGADGGLYPERVENRSFELPNAMMVWKQLDRGDGKGQLY